MRPISVDVVQSHLRATGSAIFVGDYGMPANLGEYAAFHVVLDAKDADRLFVWHEHRANTSDRSYFVRDVAPSAASHPRITPFIHGKDHLPPADLRTSNELDIVIVSNDIDSGPLSIIDGNHRVLAQYLTLQSIKDVPAYACVHPEIIKWWGLPPFVRR